MASSKIKSFYVMAKLQIDCNITIKAASLEDAVEQSKKLKEKDFVTVLGEFNDGNLAIYGAFEEL